MKKTKKVTTTMLSARAKASKKLIDASVRADEKSDTADSKAGLSVMEWFDRCETPEIFEEEYSMLREWYASHGHDKAEQKLKTYASYCRKIVKATEGSKNTPLAFVKEHKSAKGPNKDRPSLTKAYKAAREALDGAGSKGPKGPKGSKPARPIAPVGETVTPKQLAQRWKQLAASAPKGVVRDAIVLLSAAYAE